MIYTEAEAKQKWCPMVRVNVGMTTSVNRIWQKFKEWADSKDKEFHEEQETNCKCIGSECMMWHWLMQSQSGSGASLEMDGSLSWSDTASRRPTRKAPESARGYCGLAPLVR